MRGRIKLPITWREAFGDIHDEVKLIRSFGYPDGIEPGDIIWLELDFHQDATVDLNDAWLGILTTGPLRIDVTSLLKPRNVLCLAVGPPTTDELDQTILEAALLIESFEKEQ